MIETGRPMSFGSFPSRLNIFSFLFKIQTFYPPSFLYTVCRGVKSGPILPFPPIRLHDVVLNC
jgi:hypothetical protein